MGSICGQIIYLGGGGPSRLEIWVEQTFNVYFCSTALLERLLKWTNVGADMFYSDGN